LTYKDIAKVTGLKLGQVRYRLDVLEVNAPKVTFEPGAGTGANIVKQGTQPEVQHWVNDSFIYTDKLIKMKDFIKIDKRLEGNQAEMVKMGVCERTRYVFGQVGEGMKLKELYSAVI
jgi:hypothetical protein